MDRNALPSSRRWVLSASVLVVALAASAHWLPLPAQTPSWTPDTARIKCRVVDEEGVPIRHARVQVEVRYYHSSDSEGRGHDVQTDGGGRLVLDLATPRAQNITGRTASFETSAPGKWRVGIGGGLATVRMVRPGKHMELEVVLGDYVPPLRPGEYWVRLHYHDSEDIAEVGGIGAWMTIASQPFRLVVQR